MEKVLRYPGKMLAVDASRLFADPEFRSWLGRYPRARWRAESHCCDALFTHVEARFGEDGFEIDGADITLEDPQVPRAAIELIERAMQEAGLEEFEGVVWLSDEGTWSAEHAELERFVKKVLPDAKRVRVRFSRGCKELEGAIYPWFELEALEGVDAEGKTVDLVALVEDLEEPDEEELQPPYGWYYALYYEDHGLISDLLEALARHTADPYQKENELEVVL